MCVFLQGLVVELPVLLWFYLAWLCFGAVFNLCFVWVLLAFLWTEINVVSLLRLSRCQAFVQNHVDCQEEQTMIGFIFCKFHHCSVLHSLENWRFASFESFWYSWPKWLATFSFQYVTAIAIGSHICEIPVFEWFRTSILLHPVTSNLWIQYS